LLKVSLRLLFTVHELQIQLSLLLFALIVLVSVVRKTTKPTNEQHSSYH